MNAVEAFRQLSEQTSTEFLFPYDLAESRTTQAVVGRHTVLNALDIMLRNTGLASGLSEKGAITIFLSDSAFDSLEGRRNMNSTKKNILASTIAFFVGSGAQTVVAQDQSNVSQQAGQDWLLEEVIVTATKRETSLQDTAMSISVLGADEIERKSLVSMRDYLNTVPGVTSFDRGPGYNQITIRGIGFSQLEQSSVSSYFGEIPLSSPVGQGHSTDIKMVDLARVEVLRGPQGTLYGSGAMAGTVRNIPNAPDLNEFGGSVDVGYNATSKSDDGSNKIIGVLNVPLIEGALALRVAAYRYDVAGYVDRVSTPEDVALAASRGLTVSTKRMLVGTVIRAVVRVFFGSLMIH